VVQYSCKLLEIKCVLLLFYIDKSTLKSLNVILEGILYLVSFYRFLTSLMHVYNLCTLDYNPVLGLEITGEMCTHAVMFYNAF